MINDTEMKSTALETTELVKLTTFVTSTGRDVKCCKQFLVNVCVHLGQWAVVIVLESLTCLPSLSLFACILSFSSSSSLDHSSSSPSYIQYISNISVLYTYSIIMQKYTHPRLGSSDKEIQLKYWPATCS